MKRLARTLSGEALLANARGLLRILRGKVSEGKSKAIRGVLPLWRRQANMRNPPRRQAADAISLGTLKTLIRRTRGTEVTKKERRALDIFTVAFVTMSRVGEIAALEVGDVVGDGEAIDVRPKTGAREWSKLRKRVSSGGLRAAEILARHKRQARENGKKLIFGDEDDKPPTTAEVTIYLKRLSARLGVDKRISAHSARKGAAVEAVLAGVPLPVVQALGGWRDINTLQAYIGEALRRTVPWMEAAGTGTGLTGKAERRRGEGARERGRGGRRRNRGWPRGV